MKPTNWCYDVPIKRCLESLNNGEAEDGTGLLLFEMRYLPARFAFKCVIILFKKISFQLFNVLESWCAMRGWISGSLAVNAMISQFVCIRKLVLRDVSVLNTVARYSILV